MFGIAEIKQMNAKVAREKAEAVKAKGPEIKELVRRVFNAIESAVEKGETKIEVNPIANLRCIVTPEQREAVWNYVRSLGYKITIGKRFRISW